MSICNDSNSAILSVNQPASLSWGMGQGVPGSLDGIILRPGGSSTWKAPPNNVMLKHGRFFVPQGFGSLPLKNEEMHQKFPENSMMVFSQNVASPLCKSDYSTMGGQICSSPSQRSFIGERRGNNKNFLNNSF
jgi:hypothetical protein